MMGLVDYYTYVTEEIADPRTKDWFLVRSPVTIVAILLVYSYLVFIGAPNHMKDRKAYSFKTFLQIYNFSQVIVNAYLVYSTVMSGWLYYGHGCHPLDKSTTGDGYNMAVAVWIGYMVKLIDLSETIIFVLRKKDQQVSTLHVYHHISTPLLTWLFAKWSPGGGLATILVLNCSVHVVMYSYYLLSTGGPFLQSLINPIKRWITIMQMTQFVAMMIHALQFLAPSCDIPLPISIFVIVDVSLNFILFFDFYRKNYRKKRSSAKCD